MSHALWSKHMKAVFPLFLPLSLSHTRFLFLIYRKHLAARWLSFRMKKSRYFRRAPLKRRYNGNGESNGGWLRIFGKLRLLACLLFEQLSKVKDDTISHFEHDKYTTCDGAEVGKELVPPSPSACYDRGCRGHVV